MKICAEILVAKKNKILNKLHMLLSHQAQVTMSLPQITLIDSRLEHIDSELLAL